MQTELTGRVALDGARVLVAGGSGFIGANLINALARTGARVRASLHVRPAIPHLPVADYVQSDFTRMEDCERAVAGMDVVFMCAASTSGAAAIVSSPLSHVTPNLVMNAQVMDAAYRAGVKKFVFISSTVGYPASGDRPVREEEMFTGDPPDIYFASGWMKRSAEALCRVYAEKLERPMAALVVRPSNVYGPYEKFDLSRSHVTSALVRRVVERQTPLVVWGTGDDIRDLIYVADFIDAMLLAVERDEPFLSINVASGHGVSVREILDTILRVDGWADPTIQFDATKPRTLATRRVDVSRAHQLLGFTARTGLEDGLTQTVSWYRENRDNWTK